MFDIVTSRDFYAMLVEVFDTLLGTHTRPGVHSVLY